MSHIRRAIDILGSQAELARACGQPPQAVTRWLKTELVPAKHCAAIERATAGQVTCRELRPDIFTTTPSQEAA